MALRRGLRILSKRRSTHGNRKTIAELLLILSSIAEATSTRQADKLCRPRAMVCGTLDGRQALSMLLARPVIPRDQDLRVSITEPTEAATVVTRIAKTPMLFFEAAS